MPPEWVKCPKGIKLSITLLILFEGRSCHPLISLHSQGGREGGRFASGGGSQLMGARRMGMQR